MRLSLPRRLLRSIYGSLVAYGSLYTGGEPKGAGGVLPGPPPPPPVPPRVLTGPGAAHPERVRPDVPLTPMERALLRELKSG
ncbi:MULTISPECIES: DUF6059 family protein [unclassified Streptomyces]|uniref:DUF6059 family protein n=1 Tax=unclassified Streptomyces TaxID=2593676 RepID=UPI0027E49B18|nr:MULTISPECIES: DUF6059 family protein [unclassified Streptomyces]